MSGVIPDPTNPEGPAIDTETGHLAAPAFIVRDVADPKAPTPAELHDAQFFIGWVTDWATGEEPDTP